MSTPGQTEPQGRDKKEGPPGFPKGSLWWLVFAVMFLLWNFFFIFRPQHPTEVDIPYSTFLAQIRSDNVSEVHIRGDEIAGRFRKAWAEPGKAPEGFGEPLTRSSSERQQQAPAPPIYTRFTTTFPGIVGDAGLIPLLESHKAVVFVSSPSAPWLLNLLLTALPVLILLGFFWWMAGKATRNQSGLFGFSKIKARRYTKDHPEVTFKDVAGEDEAKAELEEEVDFLRHPKKYHAVGARIPRGVLLVGPPGTGKTLLARAVAGEAGVLFFSLSASEFVEMFVGVGAGRVRDLFQQAKAAAPSIVFVDELDAVGRRRGAGVGAVNDEREQTLNQLLVEMDGFDERQEVIIMAATNRPDVLDPALLRPGRFDRQVVVSLPDRQGREGILRIHTRKLPLAETVDLAMLARSTTGFSGADLANLCNEAALVAARRGHTEVSMLDFEEAQDKVLLGSARASLVDPQERAVVAYHESGHALVAWFTPAADPVHKVSIVPHGKALGVTEQIPWEDRANYSSAYLTARLAVMLGGRSAEEVALGDITTGAENDLVEATRLARRMVTRWGMGKLGAVAFKTDEQAPFLGYELSQGRDYSEETAARIDEEVHRLLEEAHESVRALLTMRRKQLDRLVAALLQEETLSQADLVEILGPSSSNTAGAASRAALSPNAKTPVRS